MTASYMILVIGGAGYIGSHMVKELISHGCLGNGESSNIYNLGNSHGYKELGWPRYQDIKTIVKTAWKWHRNSR